MEAVILSGLQAAKLSVRHGFTAVPIGLPHLLLFRGTLLPRNLLFRVSP